ncbi:MAG: hypothetical protein HKM87_00710 [Ignavibacteriaceae bacterium]|nr:hypothetical protein [Ignavibacteriaceae bacterium]
MTYLIVFLFIVLAFTFMASMLYFSKYKQKEGSCCSSGIETDGYKEDSCISCPNKDESHVKRQIEEIEKLGLNS